MTPTISPAQTRVFLALLAEWEKHGRVTIRAVAKRLGLAGVGSVHTHLSALREAGLVAWDDGRSATLRPLFGRVA